MNAQTNVDYLIIGAGPAGVQLGYYLEQGGRDYLILEAGKTAGTFFKNFPRHRQLISINKVYTGYDDPEVNLRWDWNSLLSNDQAVLLKDFTKRYFPPADELVHYLDAFVGHYNLNIKYNCRVVQIHKDQSFQVQDTTGHTYIAQQLIIATGISKPYIPEIPGIELAENYVDCSVDPEDFVNQRVLIIGKGNSAFETADNLIETASLIHVASPNPITMAWKSHFVGHLRAVNNNILDSYQLKSQNAILDVTIKKIERQDGRFHVSVSYTHANGEEESLIYDRIIVCTGFRFDDSLFNDSCRPELAINDRFPYLTSEWESVNVKGLYFAGVLMQMRDYKQTTSAFIHGFRYNVRALYRILEQKYYNQAWPGLAIELTPKALTNAMINRVNSTSALWQQFGFLVDLFVISEQDGQVIHYQEVPRDYVSDGAFGQHDDYYMLTLEYGPNHDALDPFNVTRVRRDDVSHADQSNFLHPVIRHFSGSRLLAEHHIIEDLEAEWWEDEHIKPLLTFLQSELMPAMELELSYA